MNATERRRVMRDLSDYRHEYFKVLRWNADSSDDEVDNRERAELDDADIVTSAIPGMRGYHTIMLDLDVPAKLVPSTTPGNSHLYIDVPVQWHKYRHLLRALADAGVIERGYERVSARQRCTSLRLPWVKKKKPKKPKRPTRQEHFIPPGFASTLEELFAEWHVSTIRNISTEGAAATLSVSPSED